MLRYILILFLLLSYVAFSQEVLYKNQLSFRSDNDSYIFSDRYYSFGSHIRYSRRLSSDFIFKNTEQHTLQLNLTIGQMAYTPDNFTETDTNLFDYPFAGWMYLSGEVMKSDEKHLFGLNLEIGVTGEESLVRQIHQWYHDFINIDHPSYVAQIPGEVMMNLKGKYVYDMILTDDQSLFLSFATEASLGTKDIFLEEGVTLSFGNRRKLNNTALQNMISTSGSENFGHLTIAYRYVGHNTLIEGSFLNDNAPFTLDAKNSVVSVRIGASFRKNKNTFKIQYSYNTEETSLSENHRFLSLLYELSF
ncbi:lipid A-modifier LpxR family protein [Leptobacterium sp. I13]|uniref:lipid A-modifier LpxR family protein n=1 Tax=Leptobacterium meishanense TaxID=3128904 RepID=UPI0030EC23C5